MNLLSPPHPPLSPEQAASAAEWLFVGSSGHPALDALRRLAVQRLAAGLQAPAPASPSAPAGPGTFPNVVRAGEAVRNFLEWPGRRLKLPAPPAALDRLQAALADPLATAEDVARVVSLDMRLAASLLRVVNSPLYNLPARVETVSRAVAILGQRQVSMLALAAAMAAMFQDVRLDLLDAERFWSHSLAVAVLSHGLALAAGQAEPERHYLAGLLHDLGRLALHAMAPDLAVQVRELHRAHGLPVIEAERRVFEFDHGLLGAMIFTAWRLPHGVVAAAASHHEPEPGGSSTAQVVHLANVAAVALGYGVESGEVVPPFFAWTWENLGLSVGKLEEMAVGLDRMVLALAGGD